MKKACRSLLCLVLALLLGLALLPGSASAAQPQDNAKSGKCGENLSWTLDSKGNLTISGTGAMEDYSWDRCAPWWREAKTVTIKKGVTSIGAYAFFECYDMTSAAIPSSVTRIGAQGFMYCTSLTDVALQKGLKTIENGAFYDCDALESVEIPSSVTSVGDGAFGDCSSLKSVKIPSSVTKISEDAFYNCRSLTKIKVDAQNPNYEIRNKALVEKKNR